MDYCWQNKAVALFLTRRSGDAIAVRLRLKAFNNPAQGNRPAKRDISQTQAPKGRYPDDALIRAWMARVFQPIGRCPILMIIRLSALA